MAEQLRDDSRIRQTLERARTIAVLGAHTEPAKAAYYVPDYLHGQGYRILPVNPTFAGLSSPWGAVFRSRLDEIDEPVDLVDVFRRSERLPGHLDELLGMRPRPPLVWLQLGIRNEDVASRLIEAGIDVVQDRCTLADHRRLGIGPKKA